MPTRLPSKRQTLLDYLQRGVAMVHVDARRAGVSVPPQFADEAHLRLNLSYRYSIPDFDIDVERIVATLSFGGRPFRCVLPWTAIFGITSHATGDGQVWPEDLPAEVMQTLAERHEGGAMESSSPPSAKPRLTAIDTGGDRADEQPRPDGGGRRGHLRLVR